MPDTTSKGSAHKRRIRWALVLAATYLLAEVVGGLITHSLALLADAGHMLTDVGGLGLALFAIEMAEKPPTPERTYGWYRAEILAALANAIVLIGISVYILYEAYERFMAPPEIAGGAMLVVAAIGLGVNVAGLFILREGADTSLNVKGAYFEVLSDLLSSVGVIVAALIIWRTGWRYADPLVSAGIGLFILPRTWILLREAVGVLLEGTPVDIDIAGVRAALAELPGVRDVHDLHVWTITSGVRALSAHCLVVDDRFGQSVLAKAKDVMATRFKIGHTTIQVETRPCGHGTDAL